MYVGISSYIALLSVLMHWMYACRAAASVQSLQSNSQGSERPEHCTPAAGTIVMTALLCFESMLFGLFTTCMYCDQMYSIWSNQTYIDRLKQKRDQPDQSKLRPRCGCLRSQFFVHLREVVGDTHPVTWILPTRPMWRDREQLFGFCEPGTKLGREASFSMLKTGAEEMPEI